MPCIRRGSRRWRDDAVIKAGERQSGLSVPEHSYDNDSSLFLWRTIDFREGYEARYITIWKRQKDGSWKIAIDGGTSTPPRPAAVRH